MMSVRGDEGFVGYTGGDADVKTQLNEIIRNKAICQKVANAVAERGYSRTRGGGSVDLVLTCVSCKLSYTFPSIHLSLLQKIPSSLLLLPHQALSP